MHILNIIANTWLQNPTFPATHEHEALTTSPDKIHRAIFRLWGGSLFLKLWQHFPLKTKYLELLAHSISSRYSSSKKRLAFTNPVGTVWCSTLAIAFPDFKIWRFIWSRVNIGIFSSEVPHPELGNCTDSLLPGQAQNSCLAFPSYGFIFCEDLDPQHVYLYLFVCGHALASPALLLSSILSPHLRDI